jgi:hypothetical protein
MHPRVTVVGLFVGGAVGLFVGSAHVGAEAFTESLRMAARRRRGIAKRIVAFFASTTLMQRKVL